MQYPNVSFCLSSGRWPTSNRTNDHRRAVYLLFLHPARQSDRFACLLFAGSFNSAAKKLFPCETRSRETHPSRPRRGACIGASTPTSRENVCAFVQVTQLSILSSRETNSALLDADRSYRRLRYAGCGCFAGKQIESKSDRFGGKMVDGFCVAAKL